jgi:hypothetical protein
MTSPAAVHRALLDALPELGDAFAFDSVLANFGQFAWERQLDADTDVVRRAFGYVEWLHEHHPGALAERALSAMFRGVPWNDETLELAGPRTRAALAAAGWWPR